MTLTAGALAFIGPAQAPNLPEFTYIRIKRVGTANAVVVAVGPDQDDSDEFEVPVTKLRHRIVSDDEAATMPGSYVSHTVAFVQPTGPEAGQWAYGVVTGYRMVGAVPTLTILHGTSSVGLIMDNPASLIKVDYVNYALQVGAGTNCTATNAHELLDIQNEIAGAFKKRRGVATEHGVIPKQITQLLNTPFSPDEIVPIMRPNDLATVWVRRQHLVDTAKQSPKHPQGAVFKDPVLGATPSSTNAAIDVSSPRTDIVDDGISSFLSSASADAEEVRNQNTTLRKRRRELSDTSSQLSYDSPDEVPEPRRNRPPRTAFRPSSTQRAAHKCVVSRSHKGKDPQELLELTQHSSHVVAFLATPPVLRGLFEFGFGDRGLELMHCKRASKADKIAARDKGVNMTDFSEKNVLRPATKPRDRADVTEALRSLRLFGRYFYNEATNTLIDTAASFVDEYTGLPDDDAVGWHHIALWISEKLGKYISLLVCNDHPSAQGVVSEFTRHDEALARFNDLRQPARAAPPQHRSRQDDGARRGDRAHQRRTSTVADTILAGLPRQGNRSLCMKYLSVAGCSGNGNGGCFDPRRAHFRPSAADLRSDARALIAERYQAAPPPEGLLRLQRDSKLLQRLHDLTVQHSTNHVQNVANTFGLVIHPFDATGPTIANANTRAVSELARRSKLPLSTFVRLLRGQTPEDPRPNKHLHAVHTPLALEATRQWNAIVRDGVLPTWCASRPARQVTRPPNHGSVSANVDAVRRHLRKGALDGRYLVVEESLLEQWPEVFISPLGVVEKRSPDGTDIRIINDYSFPDGASVNDFTVRDEFPTVTYNPPSDIARRITELRRRHPLRTILIMLGDVAGAFRHVPMHADAVHMFAFRFDNHVVIDLACGFGWCGSPAFYSLAGRLIDTLYSTSLPRPPAPLDESPFAGNVWCDDHTCIEVATGTRCDDANIALRRAMITVLGPTAVNEKKFTPWRTTNKALGLVWNTAAGTVSIPGDKLDKAMRLVSTSLQSRTASTKELHSLLGTLRHVVVCFPPARAFYQRLQGFSNSFRAGRRRIPPDAVDDLHLFAHILRQPKRFNGIPVALLVHATPPSVHIHMDASDVGLCVLDSARREYIRHRFTEEERAAVTSTENEYSINVRELQSAVLAAVHWGAAWRLQAASSAPVHIRLHIDNTSAVSWTNRRASPHPLAQCFLRLLSAAEFQHCLVLTAEHIAGEINVMADAGSHSHRRTVRSSLRRVGRMLRRHALADTTIAKYSSHWRQWSEFCRFMRWPRWLDASTRAKRRLHYFVIYLWRHGWNHRGRGNQYATIKLKLASVLWFHRRYQGLIIHHDPRLQLLLQGIKRLSDPVKKKQAITPAFLRQLLRTLDLRAPRQRLLWGSVLLAYFFLLRRSEYLVVGCKRSFYCLKLEHVFFSDARGNRTSRRSASSVTIGLEGAKNDQYGRGAWRTMHASGDRRLCPVQALKHILDARQALSSTVKNSRYLCADLSSDAVSAALKRTASSIGVPAANYATHSIRIGGATALLSGRADSLSIKLLGRWMSRCYEEYPVQAAAATTDLASRMV